MTCKRIATAAAALALATGISLPTAAHAEAKPASKVYGETKSCKATTALNPFVGDFTNSVRIEYTRPDRVGSGKGVYLKAIRIRSGGNHTSARIRITSHETPRREETWRWRGTDWRDIRTPPESSRRNVTRVSVRVANLADAGQEHTACTIAFDK